LPAIATKPTALKQVDESATVGKYFILSLKKKLLFYQEKRRLRESVRVIYKNNIILTETTSLFK
jgi:hypothetical protein